MYMHLFFIAILSFSTLSAEPAFLQPCDPLLQARATEVAVSDITSHEVQEIIDRMFAIATNERNDLKTGAMVGLAAPQIGVSKRIILVDVGFDCEKKAIGELKAYINPCIIWTSSELQREMEGCYSVDKRVIGHVTRPKQIKVVAYDRAANLIEVEYSGVAATIFQHEIDHLEGIRFPDRIDNQADLHWVTDEALAKYRLQWKNWDIPCPFAVWEAMKNGHSFTEPFSG